MLVPNDPALNKHEPAMLVWALERLNGAQTMHEWQAHGRQYTIRTLVRMCSCNQDSHPQPSCSAAVTAVHLLRWSWTRGLETSLLSGLAQLSAMHHVPHVPSCSHPKWLSIQHAAAEMHAAAILCLVGSGRCCKPHWRLQQHFIDIVQLISTLG